MPFDVGKSLSQCKRVAILLPEGFQEILLAFPAVQSLVEALPDREFLVLGEQDMLGFVSALYGPEQVMGLRPGEIFWGEEHFQEVLRRVTTFRPDIFINLRAVSSPLLHFLMRASLSPLRIHAAPDARRPFANILLTQAEPANILRRFLMVPRLWDFTENPVAIKWSRLGPSPENLRDAGSLLASKGLDPDRTRIFLWQDCVSSRQRELLQAARSERGVSGAAKSLLVLNGSGPLHATPAPPRDFVQGLSCLEVESTGLLLGLFARTSVTIGMNGPLLQLAGLADTDVEAHFAEADSPWDTAFLNPRLRVIYSPDPSGSPATEGAPGADPRSRDL